MQVRVVQIVALPPVAALVTVVGQEELARHVVEHGVCVGYVLHNKISNTVSGYGSGRCVHFLSSCQSDEGRAFAFIFITWGSGLVFHLQRERYGERVRNLLVN